MSVSKFFVLTSLIATFSMPLSWAGDSAGSSEDQRDPGVSPTGTSHQATQIAPGARTSDDARSVASENSGSLGMAGKSIVTGKVCTSESGTQYQQKEKGFTDCVAHSAKKSQQPLPETGNYSSSWSH